MKRPKILHYYMDDSGTRKLDRHPQASTERDWFAMGGLLVWDNRRQQVKDAHQQFCDRWSIGAPLHSVQIRHRREAFSWLANRNRTDIDQFFGELGQLMLNAPIVVHGCVIDRPGYWNRYHAIHRNARWKLCKTAFDIAVERAAKIADHHGAILKVHVERSSKKDEQRIRRYFTDMKYEGMPFDAKNSAIHKPLRQGDLRKLLDDIDFKTKGNAIMQIADLVLYPICRAAYQPDHYPYRLLSDAGKLADTRYPDHMRIKYSCFD